MMLSLRDQIGGMGKFGRIKPAQEMRSAIKVDACAPFSAGRIPTGTQQMRALVVPHCPPLVLVILAGRCLAQIRNSVIRWRAVDVVYFSNRPRAMDVQPCQSVTAAHPAVNHDDQVASTVQATGRSVSVDAFTSSPPCKHTGFWVVVKQFAQTLRGKIGRSHDAVLSLIGQRPARVCSTGGPRHFSHAGWRLTWN